MSKYSTWVIVIVVLLVGVFVGYSLERQRAIGNMEAAKLSFQNQLNTVNAANQKLATENKQLQTMLSPTPTPSEETKEVKITPKVTASPTVKSE